VTKGCVPQRQGRNAPSGVPASVTTNFPGQWHRRQPIRLRRFFCSLASRRARLVWVGLRRLSPVRYCPCPLPCPRLAPDGRLPGRYRARSGLDWEWRGNRRRCLESLGVWQTGGERTLDSICLFRCQCPVLLLRQGLARTCLSSCPLGMIRQGINHPQPFPFPHPLLCPSPSHGTPWCCWPFPYLLKRQPAACRSLSDFPFGPLSPPNSQTTKS
jgi:hypothetical protein